MILGLGTDIIEISRIHTALQSQHFVERVFTKYERQYCDSRGAQRDASYAVRFAGKEAVLKAFGTGLRGGSLLEIEILPDALGCPQVSLHGYYAQLAAEHRVGQILISLSHAKEYAVAQCIFEEENR